MRLLLMGIFSGLSEVRAHKLRSFLTLLGITLGAAALVGMLGVVKGMMRGWESMIYETGGIERITISSQAPPERQREIAAQSPGRTLADVEAITEAVPLAQRVTGEVNLFGARLAFQSKSAWQNVRGVLPATFPMDRYEVADGRLIGDLDVEQKNQVVFIPLTTAQTLFRTDEKLDVLNVQLGDVADIHAAMEQISNVLLHTHRAVEDTRLETREEMLVQFEKTRASYAYSLGGVAAIGLIVGGIGIMNVMLASINERVREIGVRRALGAKRRDILIQILAETFTLAIAGGLLGMVASVGLIMLLQKVVVASNRPELSPGALVIGIFFSGFVGVVAGLYPAYRASRLSPVEALRSD